MLSVKTALHIFSALKENYTMNWDESIKINWSFKILFLRQYFKLCEYLTNIKDNFFSLFY